MPKKKDASIGIVQTLTERLAKAEEVITEYQRNIRQLQAVNRISQAKLEAYQWQPIETAPRDETEILLYCPDEYSRLHSSRYIYNTTVEHGYYKPRSDSKTDFQLKCSDDHRIYTTETIQPTHWMPLPKAPTKEFPNLIIRKRTKQSIAIEEILKDFLGEENVKYVSGNTFRLDLAAAEWAPAAFDCTVYYGQPIEETFQDVASVKYYLKNCLEH